ncbi:MAG: indolepyruvate ferredoxin oxidoreductase family protein [Rhodocyclaceae bacterium]|jgi:indolepyruvate ferredoxin oxidoreductase|nr:indolepyruvate ferredoxin oxidoreductase family protein [Rhodocyclaceae bacterium]
MNAPIPEALRQALATVTLDDKYALDAPRAYMSGTQALVRLTMLQRERDRAAGLNTAGFVSGYRGSPLGALDQELWKAKRHLARHDVTFRPGVNEDLAATAVWGTQQVGLFPGAKVDGVFAMWYGKGPGVDRSLDVLKHANLAGTSRHGGTLLLAGDDHACKSSSSPHQSDLVLKAAGIPVIYPSSVQEYLDLGLHAWAMSRYSGCWVAMKCVSDVVESSASVLLDPHRVQIQLPTDFVLPPAGLNIRWPDPPLEQEARLMDYKLYAALAYVRANQLNRTVIDSPNARFGIIATGKAYLDTLQALQDLGLDEDACRRLGIRLHKVSVVWPLEASITREFASGLQEILVVEEKRQIIEYALKEELYNWREDVRPRVIGKFDEKDGGEYSLPQGQWLLSANYELSPSIIAKAIASRLSKFELPSDVRERMATRLATIDSRERALDGYKAPEERLPFFCSGCPHNTSTKVPEGSRALAGIGCHYMSLWMPERHTDTFTQMGGEGVTWTGMAPYTEEAHVFTNMGDGTYFHSGLLAIRAAIAAEVNITYKVLYNDAVAMTGGQPVDGILTVPQMAGQLLAEGVKRLVVLTDEPEKYTTGELPLGVQVLHRDRLDEVQRALRAIPGCTALIFDQTCASEKRRRRKKIVNGKPGFPDPAKRLFINSAVCEGCGDCSVQSSCLSIEPLETDWGRKRVINQSTCNKDYSCVKGFCPSFVTVLGGTLKKAAPSAEGVIPPLPEPELPAPTADYSILVTGVGGTGVVTIGALMGMAAHLEGRGVSVLDQAGLAQKGGAVMSHVRFGLSPETMFASRIPMGCADAIIGCDAVVSSGAEALSKAMPGRTRAVVNSTNAPTAAFLRNPDWRFPEASAEAAIAASVGPGQAYFINAGELATRLIGDSIATNPFMLGFAWQQGWIPLRRESLLRAIELNGVAIAQNQRAFELGRWAAVDLPAVIALGMPPQVIQFQARPSLDALIAQKATFLTDYQNAAYAQRYLDLVNRVRVAEARLGGTRLTEAVAQQYARLLAYKDEYEVARLYTRQEFRAELEASFEGDYTLEFHLAPPLWAKRNARGEMLKARYGPWVLKAFGALKRLKFLRGTALDPFGWTAERREERQLIADYEADINGLLTGLNADTLPRVVALARLPETLRGYGHVKAQNVRNVRDARDRLLAGLHNNLHCEEAQRA